MRPTYAEIDLGAIRHNVSRFVELLAPAEVCAVVKADGYGHGDVPVATAAIDAGATRLAVALVEEGIRLREAGVGVPILVLSEPDVSSVAGVARFGLTPSVYSLAAANALASTGAGIPVHIKVDTGMHRVGCPPELVPELVTLIGASPNLTLEGVFTHFPVADEDPSFTRSQITDFDRIVGGLDIPFTHMANTAGAILFPEARRDFCRVGLGIYGLHPCDDTRELVDLRPAMRVVSHVSHVRSLDEGARPSYGRVRALGKRSSVATVPIGYADGYSRHLTHSGEVLIHGSRHPLAGMVTMDQIVVDLGDHDVERGDEVVLLGRQGNDEISADDLARLLGTITHEIVCKIGPRVPRRYTT